MAVPTISMPKEYLVKLGLKHIEGIHYQSSPDELIQDTLRRGEGMHVNDALIDKLSRLAMLEFSDEERVQIKADLENMIGFVDKLKELQTDNVEPLLHMTSQVNVFREDVPGNMLTREEALKNAADHDNKFFKVPRVIKKPD